MSRSLREIAEETAEVVKLLVDEVGDQHPVSCIPHDTLWEAMEDLYATSGSETYVTVLQQSNRTQEKLDQLVQEHIIMCNQMTKMNRKLARISKRVDDLETDVSDKEEIIEVMSNTIIDLMRQQAHE